MAYTTIDNPELFFQCKLYSGSSSDVTVTFDGSEDMQPDLVWLKKRSGSGDHLIFDSVRGVNKRLQPNATDAEVDRTSNNDELKSFNSDGWTLGTYNSNVTGSGSSNVSWNWKKSATAGFDILTFTGNASGNQTISHNLSAVPKFWHIKRLDQASNWCTYHVGLGGADHNVFLNTNSSVQTDTGIWNNTLPTSSVFSVGNNIDANGSGASHVWYGWSEVQGFSKFGKYDSGTNPFIYTGHRPAFLMIKCTTATESWTIFNNKTEPTNDGVMSQLNANGSSGEGTLNILFLSNGFKILEVTGQTNKSGSHSYVYASFAEQPFVNSKGVPANAR